MLESAVVQVSLDDFQILREEGNQFRLVKKVLGRCCTVDTTKFEETNNPEDIVVVINKNKLADVIRKYATVDTDCMSTAAEEALKDEGISSLEIDFK